MATESNLQSKIIKFLKEHNAYVIKTKPGAGTPVGCPDIIGLYQTEWVALEVKASRSAPYQPGQELTLRRLKADNPFVYRVYPENWEKIQKELETTFFV